jgi:hypothetical protein
MSERAHDDDVAGCGIGPPLCREIVEAHGGAIWAEPADGGGTVMRFTVPALCGEPKMPCSAQCMPRRRGALSFLEPFSALMAVAARPPGLRCARRGFGRVFCPIISPGR